MTSVLKSSITADTSLITDGATIDAVDVTTATDDLIANDRAGLAAVTANDLNVKNLDDAITVSTGGLIKTIVNPAGDEGLDLKLAAALELLRTFLDGSGKVGLAGLQQGGASSSDVITWNGSAWAAAAAGGGGAAPIDITVTAGENLAERDIVYVDVTAAEAFKLDVDAVGAIKAGAIRGVVNEAGGISSAATGTVRIAGEVDGFTGLTAWSDVFASTTAGGYTQTKPTLTAAGGQVAIAKLGYATSTVAMMVRPEEIHFLKREELADDASMTIEHYSDIAARSRRASSYISSTDSGAELTGYSETNQDDSVWLRGATGAGQNLVVNTSAGALAQLGAIGIRDSQSFQITAGKLTQFKVNLGANTGSPTGTITWEIRTDSSGPATLLQSGTFTPTPSAINTVDIDDGIFLAATTTYHLVFWATNELIDAGGNNFNVYHSTSSTYAGGNLYQSGDSGSSWTSYPALDIYCEITTSAETPRDKLAQGFQISAGADIAKVQLYLRKIGSPTGNLTVKLETDSAGYPSGSTVTNGTSDVVAASTLSTSYGYIEFEFSTAPTLTGSTQYHLVLETADSASDVNYVAWGADFSAPSYSNGVMAGEISASWAAEGADAIFSVNQTGTLFDGVAVVGRWDGGTRDVAVRFDDGASVDADTKTTFKNVSGVTLDLTCEVLLK